jgi:hypothetical protein
MRIALINEAETVKPGMKLYLGNRYDIVNNKILNMSLDRTGMNQSLEFTVPRNATEEQLNIIKDMIINRTLSTVKLDGDVRFNKTKIVEEAKSFSYKSIADMTMGELKYLATKLNISIDKDIQRNDLKNKLKNAVDKENRKKVK